MTDAECAAILAEFRTLRLGPELSAALDHAIARLSERETQGRAWIMGAPPFPQHPPVLPYSTDLREHFAKAALA